MLHPDQKGIYQGVTAIRRTTGPYAGGPNVAALRAIAARTGGGLYEDQRRGTLPELFLRALREFRSNYLLSFTPAEIDNGWHEITVRVKSRGYMVRARKGYGGTP